MPGRSITLAVILTAAFGVCLSAGAGSWLAAANPAVNKKDRIVLYGNIHPQARPRYDVGQTGPSTPETRIILLLKRPPDKQQELDQLLAEQLDKSSPNYHHWLTPEQFGNRFGPSLQKIAVVKRWLVSNGFSVEQVAKGRTWINFSGTVADVENAFQTKIHNYYVNGRLYHANSTDPSIPRALADIAAGPVSLNNFPVRAMHTPPRPIRSLKSGSQYWDPAMNWYELTPHDFQTVYNLTSILDWGYTGTGVTIAIAGQTTSTHWPDDWNTFRSTTGLPGNTVNIICNGPCPANNLNDEYESDLDVEWAGAVAYGATIDYVTSQGSNSNSGVDFSAQYIVDNRLAPILSESYGLDEQDMGANYCAFYESLWAQAAAEGITVFVSSGDQGAFATTSNPNDLRVNGLASTPYNVAVGGTEFAHQSSPSFPSYWDGNGYAKSYIPETSWNDGYDITQKLWASGGGASAIYTKPAWQECPGVPNDGKRDLPDLSLDASGNVGYEVMVSGSLLDFGGTSASAPALAGIMALIVQSTGGQWQGNANTVFYQLGNAQYSGKSGASTVFHDINDGSNNGYYAAGNGYDQVTGLGSVDATRLLLAFEGSAGLWQDAVDLGNGWKRLPWFGNFNTTHAPWIYHQTLGWLYPYGTSQDSIWFWDPVISGFWWTGRTTYPYVYSADDQTWLYYLEGSSNPRWFYNFKSGSWEVH